MTNLSKRILLTAVAVSIALIFAGVTAYVSVANSSDNKFGIVAKGVHLTAAGFMLDFRYTILDAKKAAPLLDRTKKAYLIDEATGGEYRVPSSPKVGPLRQTTRVGPPKEGRTYFVMFGNPAKQIEPGQKVRVVIGDYNSDPMIVRK